MDKNGFIRLMEVRQRNVASEEPETVAIPIHLNAASIILYRPSMKEPEITEVVVGIGSTQRCFLVSETPEQIYDQLDR